MKLLIAVAIAWLAFLIWNVAAPYATFTSSDRLAFCGPINQTEVLRECAGPTIKDTPAERHALDLLTRGNARYLQENGRSRE